MRMMSATASEGHDDHLAGLFDVPGTAAVGEAGGDAAVLDGVFLQIAQAASHDGMMPGDRSFLDIVLSR